MSDSPGDGSPSSPTTAVGKEPIVVGYCVHCRTKQRMQNVIQVRNRRGRYDLKGSCAVCGKSMYRLGGWESLASAAQREAEKGRG